VNYTSDQMSALKVEAEIDRSGGRAVAIRADVSSESDVQRLFDEAEDALGPLSGLVNNAGIGGRLGRFDSVDPAELRRIFEVNVIGAMLCSQEAVRRMSTKHGGKGGTIVNVSSRAAALGGANEWVHYAASKGAIETLTRGLAREVAAEGIRVNAVAPGLIETEMHERAGDPERLARMAPALPMRRPGKPEEVAETIVWLMSPASSYVTGTIIDVSGGR
jgi:NAD(P)-dependent dehydrogenase (short-subunit alcohol dehydrogenase family)